MSETLRQLQEKRQSLAAKIREMSKRFDQDRPEHGGWENAEDEQVWQKLNGDYDANLRELEAANARAEVAKRIEELNGEKVDNTREFAPAPVQQASKATQQDLRNEAYAGWFNYQLGREVTPRQRKACKATGIRPNSKYLEFNTLGTAEIRRLQRLARNSRDFFNALTTTTDSSGKATIQDETLARTLEVNMLAHGPMRVVADVIQTASGETFSWPTADNTSNSASILNESTSVGSAVEPTFSQVQWSAYKYKAGPIFVPQELFEDSVVDLASVLGEMLGEQIGRGTNAHFTTGDGSSKPNGIVTASSLGVTTAGATAITINEVIDLVHSVDPAYRNSNPAFMCHDNVVAYLRKLQDGDTRNYWVDGYSVGMPDKLYGFPVYVNQAMASSLTATYKTMLFGDFSKYKIRRVNGLRLYRLTERYRDVDQDGFFAFIREDGDLLTAGTAPVKYMQQHA